MRALKIYGLAAALTIGALMVEVILAVWMSAGVERMVAFFLLADWGIRSARELVK